MRLNKKSILSLRSPSNPHLRLSKLRLFGHRKPKTTSFYSASLRNQPGRLFDPVCDTCASIEVIYCQTYPTGDKYQYDSNNLLCQVTVKLEDLQSGNDSQNETYNIDNSSLHCLCVFLVCNRKIIKIIYKNKKYRVLPYYNK